MAARRFRHEEAGKVTFGLAFDSEEELESFLGSRGTLAVDAVETGRAMSAPSEPRPPGRPSMDARIAAAMDQLADRLAECDSIAARARLLCAHLKETLPPGADLPAERTVRVYLTLNPRESWQKMWRKRRRV
jgi:hypothetical protein